MSANLVPSNVPASTSLVSTATVPPTWQSAEDAQEGSHWARYFAALLRYKWLVILLLVTGTAVGVWYTTLQRPVYTVNASLWIGSASAEGPGGGKVGGATDPGMGADAWSEFLSSRELVEDIIRKNRLYIAPAQPADSVFFASFEIGERFAPGNYVLEMGSPGAGRYRLLRGEVAVDSGAVGDSIGRSAGFLWAPDSQQLGDRRTIAFTARTPQSLSSRMTRALSIWHPAEFSNVLRLVLTWDEPRQAARIMNSLLHEYVALSGELERRNVTEIGYALRERVDQAQQSLAAAEHSLASFRVNTITLPSEGTALAGGIQSTDEPVMSDFFNQKIQAENVRRDRVALEAILADAQGGPLAVNALYAIPATQGPVGPDLKLALDDLARAEAALRAAQQVYTEDYKAVRDLRQSIEAMKSQTIPVLVRGVVDQLRRREADLNSRIASASRELQAIPSRTIEEMRLRREVSDRDNQVSMLKSRYEQVRMAEASTVPDVSILDTAVVPFRPDADTTVQTMLIAIGVSLVVAIVLALLLDSTDRRFRYPEQATHELGLPIIGALPHIRRTDHGITGASEAAQLVESFRSIRLNLRHTFNGGGPVAVTISSPGVGDGKSLLSSNLALSFAEAGYNTLLIDGDIRRGDQHNTFKVSRTPGLLDYLVGDVPLQSVIVSTEHPGLSLLPSGTRRLRGPEILVSEALPKLISELKKRYDVILVDSPPLGAGTDPFVFATVTGSMLLVLRTGETDRKMAQAKMQLLDRLPVRMLGAVLNGVRTDGVYRYYSYIGGYATQDEILELGPQAGTLPNRS